jgi:hypothetical protein
MGAAMSVITNHAADLFRALGDACSVCAEPTRFPFLHWRPNGVEAEDILICSTCCCRIKSGLEQDLAQVVAIDEYQRLSKDADFRPH